MSPQPTITNTKPSRALSAGRCGMALHRAFLTNDDACITASPLDAADRDLVRRRDWTGLVERRAIFFGLEKLAAVPRYPTPPSGCAAKRLPSSRPAATHPARYTGRRQL